MASCPARSPTLMSALSALCRQGCCHSPGGQTGVALQTRAQRARLRDSTVSRASPAIAGTPYKNWASRLAISTPTVVRARRSLTGLWELLLAPWQRVESNHGPPGRCLLSRPLCLCLLQQVATRMKQSYHQSQPYGVRRDLHERGDIGRARRYVFVWT